MFQLLDPFYRKCSATGRGLTHAVAGTPATFFLQCMDALGEPADGARFRIDISGPVDMSPQVLPLGRGEYTCTYLPVKASAGYQITIKVLADLQRDRGSCRFGFVVSVCALRSRAVPWWVLC